MDATKDRSELLRIDADLLEMLRAISFVRRCSMKELVRGYLLAQVTSDYDAVKRRPLKTRQPRSGRQS